jgi:hypothetical protein
MSMTMKQILNAVLSESSFLEKETFANSNDVDDKQMVSIANRAATDTIEWCEWSGAIKDATITMTEETIYPLPVGFLSMIPDSAWETDGSRKVDLPTPQSAWYMYRFSTLSDAGVIRARLSGKNIEVYEAKPGQKISFAYMTIYPFESAGGEAKEFYTADDDTFLYDDNSLIRGIQARWAEAKMMPQAQSWKADWYKSMNAAKGRDTGGRTIGGPNQVSYRSPYTQLWVPTN